MGIKIQHVNPDGSIVDIRTIGKVTIHRNATIGSNVIIRDGAIICSDAVVGNSCYIQERAEINGTLGQRANIGMGCLVNNGSKVGDHATLEAYVTLTGGTTVKTHGTVAAGSVVHGGTFLASLGLSLGNRSVSLCRNSKGQGMISVGCKYLNFKDARKYWGSPKHHTPRTARYMLVIVSHAEKVFKHLHPRRK